jgi:hypothetical protein
MKDLLLYLFGFVLTLVVQIFFFDKMVLPGGFIISYYISFILILPFNTNRLLLLVIAFIMGICLDAMNDTFGLHASSSVFLAWLRTYIYRWSEPVIGYGENQRPNLTEMGWNWTLKTYTIIVFGFYIWFYVLSFLRIIGTWFTLQKILLSTVSTLLVILLIQVLYSRKMNKNEL